MSEEGHVKDVNITAKAQKQKLSKILVNHIKLHFGSHQSLKCIAIVFLILPRNRSVKGSHQTGAAAECDENGMYNTKQYEHRKKTDMIYNSKYEMRI